MRCINCSIATGRLRRQVVSSLDLPFQRLLVEWLTIHLPEDGHICRPCFLTLTSEGANRRLQGHTMVCLGCGRSVRDIRHHVMDPETPLLLHFPFTARLQRDRCGQTVHLKLTEAVVTCGLQALDIGYNVPDEFLTPVLLRIPLVMMIHIAQIQEIRTELVLWPTHHSLLQYIRIDNLEVKTIAGKQQLTESL